MTEPVIVRWGGGLAGFAPNPDPDHPEPPELVERAAELVHTLVGQPHTETVDFRRWPIWGLLRDRTMWCFTVQGRGGGFGRAGVCEFLFLPGDWHPARAWRTGLAKVGADGRLTRGGDRPPFDLTPARPAVVAALTGLAAGRRKLALDGEPHEVAAVIAALLTVLPVAVAAERFWITYPVKPPVAAGAVATGRWPADLARERDADRLLAWLDNEDEPSPLPEKEREAVEWMADRALENTAVERYRDAPSMREFVDAVVRDELDVDVEDVPHLLRQDPVRLLRGAGPEVARTWARYRPVEAIGELLHGLPDTKLRGMLFDGVLEASVTTCPGLFPPTPEGSLAGWHDLLADLLRWKYPAKSAVAQFVREYLCVPGGPLESPEARVQATGWLRRLGLTAEDPGLEDLFPMPVEDIAAELEQRGRLSEPHKRRLLHAADPVGVLRAVLDHLPRPSPKAAVSMLQAVPDEPRRRTLLSEMLEAMRRGGDHDDAISRWLTDVVRSWPTSDSGLVVDVGARLLNDARQVDSGFLREVLRFVAAGQPAGLSALVGEAGSRLGAGGQADLARRPVPVGAGPENPVGEQAVGRYSFPDEQKPQPKRQLRRRRTPSRPKPRKRDRGDETVRGEAPRATPVAEIEATGRTGGRRAGVGALGEHLPAIVVWLLLLVTVLTAAALVFTLVN
ncbi:hypothetical protein ACWED2_42505 [Amycolatopsis sp. NPDC005003]